MTTSEFSSFPGRVKQAISNNRAATFASLAVLVLAAAGGAIIGLNPAISLVLVLVVVGASIGSLRWRTRAKPQSEHPSGRGVLTQFALIAIATLAIIQLVPYGRSHSNPPVIAEPAWATPRTRELMVNACFGCHSNEVEYPWYASIAPVSWAITDHVNGGRGKANYSEFSRDGEYDDTIEEIRDGGMPPRYFTIFGLHPEANLTDSEIDELIAGLRATPGLSEDDEGEDERDEDEDDDDEDDDDDDDDDD